MKNDLLSTKVMTKSRDPTLKTVQLAVKSKISIRLKLVTELIH